MTIEELAELVAGGLHFRLAKMSKNSATLRVSLRTWERWDEGKRREEASNFWRMWQLQIYFVKESGKTSMDEGFMDDPNVYRTWEVRNLLALPSSDEIWCQMRDEVEAMSV